MTTLFWLMQEDKHHSLIWDVRFRMDQFIKKKASVLWTTPPALSRSCSSSVAQAQCAANSGWRNHAGGRTGFERWALLSQLQMLLVPFTLWFYQSRVRRELRQTALCHFLYTRSAPSRKAGFATEGSAIFKYHRVPGPCLSSILLIWVRPLLWAHIRASYNLLQSKTVSVFLNIIVFQDSQERCTGKVPTQGTNVGSYSGYFPHG